MGDELRFSRFDRDNDSEYKQILKVRAKVAATASKSKLSPNSTPNAKQALKKRQQAALRGTPIIESSALPAVDPTTVDRTGISSSSRVDKPKQTSSKAINASNGSNTTAANDAASSAARRWSFPSPSTFVSKLLTNKTANENAGQIGNTPAMQHQPQSLPKRTTTTTKTQNATRHPTPALSIPTTNGFITYSTGDDSIPPPKAIRSASEPQLFTPRNAAEAAALAQWLKSATNENRELISAAKYHQTAAKDDEWDNAFGSSTTANNNAKADEYDPFAFEDPFATQSLQQTPFKRLVSVPVTAKEEFVSEYQPHAADFGWKADDSTPFGDDNDTPFDEEEQEHDDFSELASSPPYHPSTSAPTPGMVDFAGRRSYRQSSGRITQPTPPPTSMQEIDLTTLTRQSTGTSSSTTSSRPSTSGRSIATTVTTNANLSPGSTISTELLSAATSDLSAARRHSRRSSRGNSTDDISKATAKLSLAAAVAAGKAGASTVSNDDDTASVSSSSTQASRKSALHSFVKPRRLSTEAPSKTHDTTNWLYSKVGTAEQFAKAPKYSFVFTVPSQPSAVHTCIVKHIPWENGRLKVTLDEKVMLKDQVRLHTARASTNEKWSHRMYLHDSVLDVIVQHLVDDTYAYDLLVDGLSVATAFHDKMYNLATPPNKQAAAIQPTAATRKAAAEAAQLKQMKQVDQAFAWPELNEKKVLAKQRKKETASLFDSIDDD